MQFSEYFPVWDKLSPAQQDRLSHAVVRRSAPKGTVLHDGSGCMGLMAVCSGQLRAYILSEEGREVTVYRLFPYDICLFSAPCMMKNIQFRLTIETEKDSVFWLIPPAVYKSLMEESPAVANYTNELMAARFSEVMWLMEQVLWKSFDQRLARFLLEESRLENSAVLKITHEKIANHLGTAREVVTRMLRYFQNEGMVRLTRGTIELTDIPKLKTILHENALPV